jgi:hypothetical protein
MSMKTFTPVSDAQWRQADRLLLPYRRYALYLAPAKVRGAK